MSVYRTIGPLVEYATTKTQISFAVTAKLIITFVFNTRIVQSLYFLNPKFQASSHLLWLYSPVCVGPGRKPRRPVFSERGSFQVWYDVSTDSKFSNGDIAVAQQLSRFLLLASDAAIATRSSEVKVATVVMVTETLVSVINSINSHAYMSTHKADKAVQLLVQLVKDLGLNGESKFI